MTTTKIIILTVIFGIGILFLWCAFHKKDKKEIINVEHTEVTTKVTPNKSDTKTVSTNEWHDTAQRQKASNEAATKMGEHRMNNNGIEAQHIKQVIGQHRVSVNLTALNTAQDKISRICTHAEKIRSEIGRYRNNPAYLKQLYREGVGVSNEAYTLRKEIKSLNDSLYRLSRSNYSLCPVFDSVHRFYDSVYKNEVELNNRNRILRTYIGKNFGEAERRWNDNIEQKAKEKRLSENKR